MKDLPLSELIVLDSRLTSEHGTHYDDCIYRGPRNLLQLIRALERTETVSPDSAAIPVAELTDLQP